MERRPEDKPMQKAKELSQFTSAKTDPMGSWTGRPLDPYRSPFRMRTTSNGKRREGARGTSQRILTF